MGDRRPFANKSRGAAKQRGALLLQLDQQHVVSITTAGDGLKPCVPFPGILSASLNLPRPRPRSHSNLVALFLGPHCGVEPVPGSKTPKEKFRISSRRYSSLQGARGSRARRTPLAARGPAVS
jgi:hypothetical protein